MPGWVEVWRLGIAKLAIAQLNSSLGRIEAKLLTDPINNADATRARPSQHAACFLRAQLVPVEAIDL